MAALSLCTRISCVPVCLPGPSLHTPTANSPLVTMTTTLFQRLSPLPGGPRVIFWICPSFQPTESVKQTPFANSVLWDLQVPVFPIVLKFNSVWAETFSRVISAMDRQHQAPNRILARVPGLIAKTRTQPHCSNKKKSLGSLVPLLSAFAPCRHHHTSTSLNLFSLPRCGNFSMSTHFPTWLSGTWVNFSPSSSWLSPGCCF